MKNAVGREIPEEILKITGKEVFHGVHYYDGYEYQKDGPKTRCVVNSDGSKLVKTIHEALVKCEIRDGMTIGFHHHFRDGDLVVNMVMEEIHKMGIKNITICASSLGKAHAGLVPYMEDGTITGIQSSGVRGEIGKAISEGKLKGLAVVMISIPASSCHFLFQQSFRICHVSNPDKNAAISSYSDERLHG